MFKYIDNVDDLPNQCEDKQLLGIEGKLGGEVREEQGPNGIRILEPNGQKSEDSGATNGGEEATPVVAHRKVGGGDLYAEEHTFGVGEGQKLRSRTKLIIDYLPPTGAAKQAPTPTAQAAASISEFRDSFSYMPWNDVTSLLNNCATILAICTKGP